jgi:cob(I)alamin adenosyltransferase
MLYTGKGDKGTTKLFNTPSGVRVSKTDAVFEALGTVDELNSFLGLVKVAAGDGAIQHEIHRVQETLFIIQAELAGAGIVVDEAAVRHAEEYIAAIEATLPPITTFFISGGTELAARADTARSIARRAERRVIAVHEAGQEVSSWSLTYLNRLSSVLYAIARLANHEAGVSEIPPGYGKS